MTINIIKRPSTDKKKVHYTFEWGRGKGERIKAGLFTYDKPKNQVERNHSKQTLAILEMKKSHMTLEFTATGAGYIPEHKRVANFLTYYADFVKKNSTYGSRQLQGSFNAFCKRNKQKLLT